MMKSLMTLCVMVLGNVKAAVVEAMKMGIMDWAHDSEESIVEATMSPMEQLGWMNWVGEVYAKIRKSLYQMHERFLD